ncbi:hypothetical protein ACPF8X_18250 [Streptomyces sp. G35A]
MSAAFRDLVASFARSSRPEAPGLPSWPEFTPDRPSTLILGGARLAETAPTSKSRQLASWDDVSRVPQP